MHKHVACNLKMTKNKKTKYNKINILLILGGIFIVTFFGYVIFRTYQSQNSLLSIMTIPLILGIIFENRRLSTEWKTILIKVTISLVLSIFAFLPGKRERNYSFENHIEMWPYFFIGFFVFASVIYHDKKIIPKLTEGTTLLQSISIVYWIIDIGFLNFKNGFAYTIMAIGLVFCFVSFIHAFSYIKLTRTSRLFLSIWSSIIMIIFAIDHIYRVYNFDYFVDYKMLNDGLNILQYFLLGVSLIYIFQNAFMLFTYLPDKHSFYGKSQMKEIREMNKTHIKRYSLNQIKISDSIIALIFTSGIYYWNYKYQIMPRHTLIWLIFWIFPFVIWLKEIIIKKRKTTANTVQN
jgi:hypothetical protein